MQKPEHLDTGCMLALRLFDKSACTLRVKGGKDSFKHVASRAPGVQVLEKASPPANAPHQTSSAWTKAYQKTRTSTLRVRRNSYAHTHVDKHNNCFLAHILYRHTPLQATHDAIQPQHNPPHMHSYWIKHLKVNRTRDILIK